MNAEPISATGPTFQRVVAFVGYAQPTRFMESTVLSCCDSGPEMPTPRQIATGCSMASTRKLAKPTRETKDPSCDDAISCHEPVGPGFADTILKSTQAVTAHRFSICVLAISPTPIRTPLYLVPVQQRDRVTCAGCAPPLCRSPLAYRRPENSS